MLNRREAIGAAVAAIAGGTVFGSEKVKGKWKLHILKLERSAGGVPMYMRTIDLTCLLPPESDSWGDSEAKEFVLSLMRANRSTARCGDIILESTPYIRMERDGNAITGSL